MNHSITKIAIKAKSKAANKLHAIPKIADAANKIFFIPITKRRDFNNKLNDFSG